MSTKADRRQARREALRRRGPIALAVAGAFGTVLSMLLPYWCVRLTPPNSEGIRSCAAYAGTLPAAAAIAISLPAFAAGAYLIYFDRGGTYAHVCAECGRTFRDRGLVSENRVAGDDACSPVCADALREKHRVRGLRDLIPVLENLGARAPEEVARSRARERLEEIASGESEPLRGLAREALARLSSS